MKFRQFLEDGSGQLSATRLAFLVWVLGTFVVSAYMALAVGSSGFKVDSTVITLIGILMTGKVVQSFSPGDQATPQSIQLAVGGPATAQLQPTAGAAMLVQGLKETGTTITDGNSNN